jgi:hypothetical protein
MSVATDPSVEARWPGLRAQVQEAFEARGDVDSCAQVRVELQGRAIVVQVVLPDGRSTTRPVSRRDDVVPTLEALLLLPEHEAAAASTAAAEPTDVRGPSLIDVDPPRSIGVEPSTLLARERAAPAATPGASRLRIDLSVAGGARYGAGQAVIGFAASSFLEIDGWLAGFEGRLDRYKLLAGGPPGDALELAVLGGRRFRLGSSAIDLTGGPAIAVERGANITIMKSPLVAGTTYQIPDAIEPRLLLGARWSLAASSVVHPFVGVDAEIGRDVSPAAHPLPFWTAGLALGGTVATP